jgi:hypothetical protein
MTLVHRSRWLGTTLALLALVLGLGVASVGATAPAPAQAASSSFEHCFPIFDEDGNIIDVICVPIPVEVEICPFCPIAIALDALVLPADPYYVEDLARGLETLGEALLADPRQAPLLRERAQTLFLSAAERLGSGAVQVGEVGHYDHKQQVIEPDPEPWLVSAGVDLAGGLRLMLEGVTNPDPTPWIDAGMARFDAALDALVHQEIAR